MSNFGRGSPKEPSCVIISKSIFWFRRRRRLKVLSIFSSGGHLVQRSKKVRAIMVDSHLRNIPMKLFQNLSIDLAEEVVKILFLFIALVAISFNIAESFEQFWQRVTQKAFQYNYFKIHLLVQGKSFKGFSIFCSGGHLVQWSRTV